MSGGAGLCSRFLARAGGMLAMLQVWAGVASGSGASVIKVQGLIHSLVFVALLLLPCQSNVQSAATGPELFVEVLGTLAAAADACTGGSSSADAVAGSSSSPWALMCDVSPQGVVAFLSACLVPGEWACLFAGERGGRAAPRLPVLNACTPHTHVTQQVHWRMMACWSVSCCWGPWLAGPMRTAPWLTPRW